ncbi:hypothetical protein RIF29_06285 [Crotalaria pallida]|uniref:TIR domain-containing protein n=1 Tax=Crotalaria pallida TaxID=3830 RepID=A0AAN9J3A0_CROPI
MAAVQASSSSSSSSSSSFCYGWKYDVFLSFRGTDTRYGFTGNLYKALEAKGIHTFIDDEELQSGDEITPSLMKAIQDSRIAIVVLSKNYASSSFCLDELSTILDCVKGNGRLVLPVFFDVDPSHVRHHQSGTYGEALAKHEKRFKDNMQRLQNWKMALKQVANLSGFHFKQHGNEYEHEFIEKIIGLISNKIDRTPLHVGDRLIGLESRVLQVNSLLELESVEGVQMVGIWGVGGIGKSTLARAVYNSIADQFEGICFLENVRENSSKYGLVHLQETLLYEIVGVKKDTKLGSVNKGISIIKHRLCRKKVLLILDDVDKDTQLQAIAEKPDWFGFGSRVIITTRDKHLLASHGVERTYEMNGLNEKEALKLLSWKAFRNNKVNPIYEDVLRRLVLYTSGLPLALELIGSNLFGKSVEEWESALEQYKRIPHSDIQKILQVSFDALQEDEQKVFLDIACFFKRYELGNVEDILHAHHGRCIKYHIGVLVAKCLIKIDWDRWQKKHVTLHDLIEDMGKEIVRQESPENPGLRSRLWLTEDMIQVFKENKGTDKIQILILRSYTKIKDWDGMVFRKMENLKTLIIEDFVGVPEHLPNSLRVLEWKRYPSSLLPFGSHPEKLTILKLHNYCSTSFGLLKMEKFMNMRVLEFDHSGYITQIPNLSGVPNLEELSFKRCENLIKLDESVGFLDKLRILNVEGCSKLRYFPPLKLTSLETLNLVDCHSLEKFPEILGKMEKITVLHLVGTLIIELPYSIQNLTMLKELVTEEYRIFQLLPSNKIRAMFPSLEVLWIFPKDESQHGHISFDECFPTLLTSLSNSRLRVLHLPENGLTFVPACITEFHSLRELCLDSCEYLVEIRWIPPNLELLDAAGCESLKYLDLTTASVSPCLLKRILLESCRDLEEIRGISPTIQVLIATDCTSLSDSCRSMLLNQELHEQVGNMLLSFPWSSGIPVWFEHCSTQHSLSFWFRGMFPAISTCLVNTPEHFELRSIRPELNINGKTVNGWLDPELNISGKTVNGWLGFDRKNFIGRLDAKADHIVIFDIKQIKFEDNVDEQVLLENEWNHAEFSFNKYHSAKSKHLATQTGLHVFKQESSSTEDIRFTNPCEIERNDDGDERDSNSTESHQCGVPPISKEYEHRG